MTCSDPLFRPLVRAAKAARVIGTVMVGFGIIAAGDLYFASTTSQVSAHVRMDLLFMAMGTFGILVIPGFLMVLFATTVRRGKAWAAWALIALTLVPIAVSAVSAMGRASELLADSYLRRSSAIGPLAIALVILSLSILLIVDCGRSLLAIVKPRRRQVRSPAFAPVMPSVDGTRRIDRQEPSGGEAHDHP